MMKCVAIFFLTIQHPPQSTLFPYTTLFRSRARPDRRAPAGVSRGFRAWRFTRVLVAGDHRRGLHLQYVLLPRSGLHGAAGLPALHARAGEPGSQPAAALGGACFRAEPEQSLSADAARRAGLRHPAMAATPGAAQPLWSALLARDSRPAALRVDGAPLVAGVADQL